MFAPALAQLPSADFFWGPVSFRDYTVKHGFRARQQAPKYISIDHYLGLSAELRRAETMVLRLGDAEGTGTQFGLARVPGDLGSFFINDMEDDAEAETFLPTTGLDQLFPFLLIGNMAEANLVNLGFASGLFGEALKLDQDCSQPFPARGNGRYTFPVRPHSSLDAIIEHRAGQVETDAMFVARRHGRQTLFVIEAKVGLGTRSIAKHKLVYPVLAVAERVPSDMPIVPVYVRILGSADGLSFCVSECEPLPRLTVPAIDELTVISRRTLRVPNILSGFQ